MFKIITVHFYITLILLRVLITCMANKKVKRYIVYYYYNLKCTKISILNFIIVEFLLLALLSVRVGTIEIDFVRFNAFLEIVHADKHPVNCYINKA